MTAATAGAPEGWGALTEGVRPEGARLFPHGWSGDAAAGAPGGTGQVELNSRKRNTPEFRPGRLPSQLSVQTLLMFPQEVSAERDLRKKKKKT